jgi:hypothetical protein
MAHYDIEIEKYDGYVRPAQPGYDELRHGLRVGDTVTFSSSQGKFKIKLVDYATEENATPFKEPGFTIEDSNVRTVVNQGKFLFRCMLKGPGEKTYTGWRNGNGKGNGHGGQQNAHSRQKSGVEVPVPPPRG